MIGEGLHVCSVARPCPGRCNAGYRRAERMAHDELLRTWGDLEQRPWVWLRDGGWSKDADPVVVAGVDPRLGQPWWCRQCQADLVEQLAGFPELCADLWAAGHEDRPPALRMVHHRARIAGSGWWWLDRLACGHPVKYSWHPPLAPPPALRVCGECVMGSSGVGEGKLRSAQAERQSSTRTGSPSGSPAWDAIDEIVSWASWMEDRVRGRYRHSRDWRDPRVGSAEQRARTLTRAVDFLLCWQHEMFSLPEAVDVGRAITRLTRMARRGTARDHLVHHLPVVCPDCDLRTLSRRDGSDVVRCTACNAVWGAAAYRLLVSIEVDRRAHDSATG